MQRLGIAFLLILGWNSAMAEHLRQVYEFSFIQTNGEIFNLSRFKGKVLLIVNTASQCGFTGQYAGLEKLHEKYANQGLVVIGVPSNNFGGQEPGTDEQIHDFCQLNFHVQFPIVKKTSVSGPDAHPFYVWAKKELGFGTAPKWNFHKYIINRQGQLVDYFNSITTPEASRVIKVLEKCLAEPEK
jgi:glutathione peroxidase